LLVFLAGYLVPPLRDWQGQFVLLNSVCLLSCAVLLTRLDRPVRECLWVWVILAVFLLGYFVKTFVIASDIEYWHVEASWFDELARILTIDLVRAGYVWITLGFASTCAACWLVLGRRRPLPPFPELPGMISSARLVVLLAVVSVISIVFAVIRAVLGIGVHGLEAGNASTVLPFRLGTFIVRAQDVLTAIQFLCIWAAERSGSRRIWLAALTASGVSVVAISIISTSRSALLALALPVFFLWLLSARLTPSRISVIGVVAAVFAVLFPFVDALRYARLAGQTNFLEGVSFARGLVNQVGLGASLRVAGYPILFRFIGADGVWFSSRLGWPSTARIAAIARESLTGYFTTNVVGTLQERTFRSPGLVGALLVLGGWPAVVLLTPLLVFAISRLWRWLGNLTIAPVALSLGALFIFGLVNEGTFYPQNVLAFFFAVLVCDWITRHYLLIPVSVTS
jgi:hypothetical protein